MKVDKRKLAAFQVRAEELRIINFVFTARYTMCIARYCYSKSYVSLPACVCEVDVPWAYVLGMG